MFEGLSSALGLLTSNPEILAIIFIASVIGLVFGVLPGLGGITALAILLPFTYGSTFSGQE